MFCKSKGIKSPRLLRDFCELKTEGQQDNGARRPAGSLTRKEWNKGFRPRGATCVCVCNYGRKAVSGSAPVTCYAVDGGGEGTAVCMHACVCVGPVAVFLNTWRTVAHLQEPEMYWAWDKTPIILNPGCGPGENLYLLWGSSKGILWGPREGSAGYMSPTFNFKFSGSKMEQVKLILMICFISPNISKWYCNIQLIRINEIVYILYFIIHFWNPVCVFSLTAHILATCKVSSRYIWLLTTILDSIGSEEKRYKCTQLENGAWERKNICLEGEKVWR